MSKQLNYRKCTIVHKVAEFSTVNQEKNIVIGNVYSKQIIVQWNIGTVDYLPMIQNTLYPPSHSPGWLNYFFAFSSKLHTYFTCFTCRQHVADQCSQCSPHLCSKACWLPASSNQTLLLTLLLLWLKYFWTHLKTIGFV